MGNKIQGASSGNLLEVDVNNAAKVALPTTAAAAGYAKLAGADGTALMVVEDGFASVAHSTLLFADSVEPTNLNTNLWFTSSSTFTLAVSSGFLVLNNGASTTGNASYVLQSVDYFEVFKRCRLDLHVAAMPTAVPESNATVEIGLGAATTNAAPTDGAFFRWDGTDGTFRAVINNGGTESKSAALTNPSTSVVSSFDLVLAHDHAEFWVNGVQVATLPTSGALSGPTGLTKQNIIIRVYNGASTPSVAPKLSVSEVTLTRTGYEITRPFPHLMSSLQRAGYQGPAVASLTQTTNHTNSTSPSSASLSNSAAGYATLGGRWQFAAPSGATTDFALFAFQVPSKFRFVMTGIRISSVNTGAAVATTATILDWSIGVNGSAVDLSTAETPPSTYATRRVPIGMQSWIVGAAIGVQANDIDHTFATPLVVQSGRYIHVIVQVPVGTNTGSQIIRGDVMVEGYWE